MLVVSLNCVEQRSKAMPILITPDYSNYLGNAEYTHAGASRQKFSFSCLCRHDLAKSTAHLQWCLVGSI